MQIERQAGEISRGTSDRFVAGIVDSHSLHPLRWQITNELIGLLFAEHLTTDSLRGARVSRRNFLRISAGATGAFFLASCNKEKDTFPLPVIPTPSSEPYPQPVPEAEWEQSDHTTRFSDMYSGRIPENLGNFDLHTEKGQTEFLWAYEKIARESIVPVYAGFFRAGSDEIDQRLHFPRKKEELKNLLLKEGLDQTEAENVINNDAGATTVLFDPASGIFKPKQIYLNYEAYLNLFLTSQQEFIKIAPDNPLYKTDAFLASRLSEALTVALVHELTHYITEKQQVLNQQERKAFRDLFGSRIRTFATNDKAHFVYSDGAALHLSLDDNDGSEATIFGNLMEQYRAYNQWNATRSIQKLSSSAETGDVWGVLNPDPIGIFLISRLHNELGITYPDFLRNYAEDSYRDLIDFYKTRARERNIELNEQDVVEIFYQLNQANHEYYENSAGTNKNLYVRMEEIVKKYGLIIENVISTRRKK